MYELKIWLSPNPTELQFAGLVDKNIASRRHRIEEPHFKVFEEFRDTSYITRYRLLLRKLILEKHYDGAALVLSSRSGDDRGNYREPAPDLSMKRFLSGIVGHVRAFLGGM